MTSESAARLVSDSIHVPWLDFDAKYTTQVRCDPWRIVEVRAILGVIVHGMPWLANWTLDEERATDQDREKVRRLSQPFNKTGEGETWGPYDESAAVTRNRCRGIELREFNGALFVSAGQHRVARARHLGFPRVLAQYVIVYQLETTVPAAVRNFWESLPILAKS